MFTFALTHAGVYRQHQPRYTQTISCPWLTLHVCGLKRFRHLNGSMALEEPGPFLTLGVPGTRVYFETRSPRENYVLMFNGLELRRPERGGALVELKFEGGWVAVPELIPLDPGQVPGMVLMFARVLECFRNPLPINRLDAHLMVAAVLRQFVTQATTTGQGDSPAAALRRLLDQDATFRRPLPELARICGYGADHLRALFRRAYGICPQEYRNQHRLAAAMDLIVQSNLTAKEIAARTGFTYLSHFSAFFRRHAGIAPRQAIVKYRYRHDRVNGRGLGACPASSSGKTI